MPRAATWILAALSIVPAVPAFCGDWNPKLAADYMDARQKAWFEWPAAKASGGPCISCHTGVTYLLARPRLRGVLGEQQPISYEDGLLNGLRSRLGRTESKDKYSAQSVGVESILAALLLSRAEAGGETLTPDAERAFDRMWALQLTSGELKGAWNWFSLNDDPWEMPDSPYYGAALAAVAVGGAPGGYASRPEIREHVDALKAYLCDNRESQSLHNRVMLLWASTRLPGILPDPARRALIDEIRGKQQADGGWTIQSLGPWKEHAAAPPSTGSNAYATALVAFVLEQAGVPQKDRNVTSAVAWLKSHQDPKAGNWPATSMNHVYEAGSMQIHFMDDAATAFATLALLDADRTK